MRTTTIPLLLLAACGFDEKLPEILIEGKVIVPREAATRLVDQGSGPEEITDIRFLGPVYLGAYSGTDPAYFPYTHPHMGPVVDPAYPGDAYPYGGTSIGRFDFACFESIACQVTTGRFDSFEAIIEYFRDFAGQPVTNAFGEEVDSAVYFEQYCLDYFDFTSPHEMSFLATERTPEGDWVSALDFEENADGDFEATFQMHQTPFTEGMEIWGWIDNPSIETFTFSTCDPDIRGPMTYEYNQDFDAGGSYRDLLNYPSLYINAGDWVASQGFVMQSPDDTPELHLDFFHD